MRPQAPASVLRLLPSTGDGAAADLPPHGCPQSYAASPSEPKDASGKRIIDYIHPVSLALFALAGISGILLFAFYKSVAFSDFFNERISSIFRFLLAKITNPLPFSLAETVIFSLPIFVVAAVVRTVRISKHSSAKNCRFILGLLSILSLLFSMFVLNFAAAYRGSTLEDKLGLERSKVSADELVATAYALLDKIGGVIDDVQFDYGSFSIMPYSLSELSEKLCDAYASVCKKYPFLQSMRTKVKPIVLSEPMTYTHISGVYSYFTGEANINTNFPDYASLHRGARTFASTRYRARTRQISCFLVCIESDDPYIQYSGYFNMLGYVINSLYTADSAEYMRIWMSMDRRLVSSLSPTAIFRQI